MHFVEIGDIDVDRIQKAEGTFYFSRCFQTVLDQHGIISGEDKPLGPGIVPRGFRDVASLDPETPYIFEGPLSPEVLKHAGLIANQTSNELLRVTDRSVSFGADLCYLKLSVRTIPPVESREKTVIMPLEPEDKRWVKDEFVWQSFDGSCDESERVLNAYPEPRTRKIVGVRKDNWIYLGVPLLDVLCQHLTCPPIEGTSYYGQLRNGSLHELWRLVEDLGVWLAHATNRPVPRCGLWPAGKSSAFSIRHDFDRPMKDGPFRELLSFYRHWGIGSTWFWRVERLDRPKIETLVEAGQEVALHTEREGAKKFKDEEMSFFERETDASMLGYTAHGGRGSCGYLGEKQFNWAEENGMVYGEMLSIDVGRPYQAIAIRNGRPALINLEMPATHFSIDLGTAEEAFDLEGPHTYCRRRKERGEQMIVMNHPDIHLKPLMQLIEKVNEESIWHATMLESVNWCRARRSLRARQTNSGDYEIIRGDILSHDVEVWLDGADENYKTRLPKNFQRWRLQDIDDMARQENPEAPGGTVGLVPLYATKITNKAVRMMKQTIGGRWSASDLVGSGVDRQLVALVSRTADTAAATLAKPLFAKLKESVDIRRFLETGGGVDLPSPDDHGSIYLCKAEALFDQLILDETFQPLVSPWSKAFYAHLYRLVRPGGRLVLPVYAGATTRAFGRWTKDDVAEFFNGAVEQITGTDFVTVVRGNKAFDLPPSTAGWFIQNSRGVLLQQSYISSTEDDNSPDWRATFDKSDVAALSVDGVSKLDARMRQFISQHAYYAGGISYKASLVSHIIQQHVNNKDDRTAIDMGGGYGLLAAELALDPALNLSQSVCTDISELNAQLSSKVYADMAENLAERFDFRCEAAQNYTFDATYDAVIFVGSILYVPKDELQKTIQRAWDAVKPGGALIIHENIKHPRFERDFPIMFTLEEIDELMGQFGEIHRYASQYTQALTKAQAGEKTVFRAVEKPAQ